MSEGKVCLADRIRIYIYEIYNKPPIKYKPKNNAHKFRMTPRISQQTLEKALEFYEELRGEIFLNGKNPKSVAVGLIYISCIVMGNNVTQEDIAKLADCNVLTIHSMYPKLRNYFHL
jgi:transcription initiation factor TFIIIB Brf1 subunit/transcription initiation factor TFIIB